MSSQFTQVVHFSLRGTEAVKVKVKFLWMNKTEPHRLTNTISQVGWRFMNNFLTHSIATVTDSRSCATEVDVSSWVKLGLLDRVGQTLYMYLKGMWEHDTFVKAAKCKFFQQNQFDNQQLIHLHNELSSIVQSKPENLSPLKSHNSLYDNYTFKRWGILGGCDEVPLDRRR